MIKFRANEIIGFGLSEENIKRLKEGKPIMFDANDLGIEGSKIVIFYGKTEQDMQDDLSKYIGKNTKYSSDFDN